MKVRELAALLADLPQGAEIFLAADAEGNGFGRLADFDVPLAWKDEIVSGEIDRIFFEDELDELESEDDLDDLETVVLLWPV